MTVQTTEAPKTRTNGKGKPAKDKPARLSIAVPSHIGVAAAKEPGRFAFDNVAVLFDPMHETRTLLVASDGRMLAVVETIVDAEGDTQEAGLIPQFIPAAMTKHAATLRLAVGSDTNLFGPELCWRDDVSRVDMPQIQGGAYPDISGAFPRVDVGEDGWACVTLSAALLHKLARAINDPDDKDTDAVTLFVRSPANSLAPVKDPVVVVGRHGGGLLVPIVHSAEAERAAPTLLAARANDLAGRLRRSMAAAGFVSGNVQPSEAGIVPEESEDAQGGTIGGMIDKAGPTIAEEMGGTWDSKERTVTVNDDQLPSKKRGGKGRKAEEERR